MSVEYLATDTDLTAVANAIRTKGGTSAQLVFPDGFVSAVQAIKTGASIQLVVTTSAGAAVTAAKGGKTVTGTAGTDGTCTFTLDDTGEYTITVAKSGITRTETIQIGTVSIYVPLYDPVLANNSWAQIAEACRAGTIPETWTVGSSKSMTINGADYQVDIIGLNHDDYADGSGKAPLTFQLHDCYADTKMNSSNTNSGGWTSCAMRQTHLPAILALLPAEVQSSIREVNKLTSAGSQMSTIKTTADKLFLLSEVEIFGSVKYSKSGEGTQYDYYAAGNSKVKRRAGAARDWWTRSPYGSNSVNFCFASSNGTADFDGASNACAAVFAFCF